MYLVFQPLGLGLDKVLFDWNSVKEEDLWIGDSGASSHMMGSEEHVFNKKLITGSVRTASGAHMKMLCEGDINVDVITKNGDVTSGTLRVKVYQE